MSNMSPDEMRAAHMRGSLRRQLDRAAGYEPEPELVSFNAARQRLGLSDHLCRKLLDDGELRGGPLPGTNRVYVLSKSIDDLIARMSGGEL